MEQRTPEWFERRRGLFTASQIFSIMGARGFGKTGETYVHKKVAEYYGVFEDEKNAAALTWGNENEPLAKEYYSLAFGEKLYDEGFIMSECGNYGSSPDSLIEGKRKGVEFKCPYVPSNHIKYMTIKSASDLKKISPQYYWQIQLCMLNTGFDSWDFVSFDPRFEGSKRMFAIEIKRDDKDQQVLIERISEAVVMKNNIIKLIEL